MRLAIVFLLSLELGCGEPDQHNSVFTDTLLKTTDTAVAAGNGPATINTGEVSVSRLLTYAKSLVSIPYKYGSTDPDQGFDCSGFINHVFNHFGIAVPRSSVSFTNVGKTVTLENAKPGDIILFTGTDPDDEEVGHMGIITENNASETTFIHSTSGKANGVTITELNDYYKQRFVKVIRVFEANDE